MMRCINRLSCQTLHHGTGLRHYALQPCRRLFHATPAHGERNVLSLLEQRGLVHQIAGDRNALKNLLSTRKVGIYAGIDPTAPSLHLGHLLPLMVLFWLYHHGHHVVSLVGGATAKVGDPSGRLTSRAKTDESVTEANFQAMYRQLGKLWKSAVDYGQSRQMSEEQTGKWMLLNNATWLDNLNILQFLRMMGNGMRLGAMLGRDTVKNKLEKGDGMSFSELTYPLLQAWDWWQMYHDHGVQLQVGGSDQYGNLVAGIDGVKYIAQSYHEAGERQWLDSDGKLKDAMAPVGLTVPLLTTSSGEKFGKSAGNAVWLDPNLTSPFDLYGFLLRTADEDVERFLNLFTFIPIPEISTVVAEHTNDPGLRKAQHLLAGEVLELVHGREIAEKTRVEHQVMRDPKVMDLSSKGTTHLTAESKDGTPRINLPRSLVHNTPFARVLYHAGLASSKSEGARLISRGGVYVHEAGGAAWVPVQAQQVIETERHLGHGTLIVRLGKWKVRIIDVCEDNDYDASGKNAPGWLDYKALRDR